MKPPMTEKVFAYGSNMCDGRFRIYGVNPQGQEKPARLAGYRLCFNKRSTKDGSGKANVEACDGREVWGVLYSVAEQDLALLDSGEKGYRRVKLPVDTNGDRIEAWVYLAHAPGTDPALKPYSWYKRFLVEGAIAHGIDAGYIAELQQIDAIQDRNEKRDQEMRAITCGSSLKRGGDNGRHSCALAD